MDFDLEFTVVLTWISMFEFHWHVVDLQNALICRFFVLQHLSCVKPNLLALYCTLYSIFGAGPTLQVCNKYAMSVQQEIWWKSPGLSTKVTMTTLYGAM